jgi:hypothetical protein
MSLLAMSVLVLDICFDSFISLSLSWRWRTRQGIRLYHDDVQQIEQPTPTTSIAATPHQTLYSDNDINWLAGLDGSIFGNLPDWSVLDEHFSALV